MYDKLDAQGLGYYAIKKRMIAIARNDQVNGNHHYTYDNKGYVDQTILNCGNCDNLLDNNNDYWCEITDYTCTVWFKCPHCGKYNHYIF